MNHVWNQNLLLVIIHSVGPLPPPPEEDFLIQNDGFFITQNDGSLILIN